MPKRKPYAKTGDVFSIPVDETHVGFGHVLLHMVNAYPLYIAVFRPVWPVATLPPMTEIISSEVALLGGSSDALIWHGRWHIAANIRPDLTRYPWPHFICGPPERCHVENFDGQIIRNASTEDQNFYPYRFTRSPIAFQLGLKAIHGCGPWPPKHEELTYAYVAALAEKYPPPAVAQPSR
jgi:hypothetical protein